MKKNFEQENDTEKKRESTIRIENENDSTERIRPKLPRKNYGNDCEPED